MGRIWSGRVLREGTLQGPPWLRNCIHLGKARDKPLERGLSSHSREHSSRTSGTIPAASTPTRTTSSLIIWHWHGLAFSVFGWQQGWCLARDWLGQYPMRVVAFYFVISPPVLYSWRKALKSREAVRYDRVDGEAFGFCIKMIREDKIVLP